MDDQEMLVVAITSPTRYRSVAATNVFLLRGRTVTLVDVGPDNEEALDLLENGLAQWGLHVSDVEVVLLTHPHGDHFGQLLPSAPGTSSENTGRPWCS